MHSLPRPVEAQKAAKASPTCADAPSLVGRHTYSWGSNFSEPTTLADPEPTLRADARCKCTASAQVCWGMALSTGQHIAIVPAISAME
jgi:hypothetical protein